MSSNQDKIIEKYKSGFEDRRAELSRAGKMEFHYTEKLLRRYMKGLPRTIELGCARPGITLTLSQISAVRTPALTFRRKISRYLKRSSPRSRSRPRAGNP